MTANKKRSKKKQSRKGIKVGLILIGVLAFVTAAFFYLLFLSPATKFEKDEITLYINHKSANKPYNFVSFCEIPKQITIQEQ